MGSSFSTPIYRARTKRQLDYLKGKKTGRKVVKHEQEIQIAYADWFRRKFKGIHFRSDTGSGAFNSRYEKNTHNLQQSADGLPDVTIFAAKRGFHALLIELKADGVSLYMKRDGTKLRVFKDSRGRITGHDYKIRKKGDWASLHIETQAKRIEELRRDGYCAVFAVGLEKAKEITCWYFNVPYEVNTQIF